MLPDGQVNPNSKHIQKDTASDLHQLHKIFCPVWRISAAYQPEDPASIQRHHREQIVGSLKETADRNLRCLTAEKQQGKTADGTGKNTDQLQPLSDGACFDHASAHMNMDPMDTSPADKNRDHMAQFME